MARPLRIEFEGALYHITSRGNEKRDIFLDDEDRESFLEILAQINKRFNWLCHAYCLMNNHYHLLIETPEANLSKGMKLLNGIYTQRFNKKYKRVGHLYQGRYKAILIGKESHLLEVARYIVLNPTRVGIVDEFQKWNWSSFRATAYQIKPHSCLTVEWILSQFSEDKSAARRNYIRFVKAGIGNKGIWKNLRGQILLGRTEFVERVLPLLKEKERLKEIPRKQRYPERPELEEIFMGEVKRIKQIRNEKMIEAIYRYGYSLKNSKFKT